MRHKHPEGHPARPGDLTIPGDAVSGKRYWASWMAPVLAAAAVAVIVTGLMIAGARTPLHLHHAALPTTPSTRTANPGSASPLPTGPSPSAVPSTPPSPHHPGPPVPGIPGRHGTGAPTPRVTAGSGPAATPGPTAPASSSTYPEEGYNKNGVPTFSDYQNASGPGPAIRFGQIIQVSCKIYDPAIPSASPGGYWYRIASPPWRNSYYAVANTFLNGDPPGGPYTHPYDPDVPNCPS